MALSVHWQAHFAGMDAIANERPETHLLLTAPGDTPFLPIDLVARLSSAKAAKQASIAVAVSGGRVHHTVALWDISLRDALRKALIDDGVRAVSEFISRHKKVDVDWSIDPFDPFLMSILQRIWRLQVRFSLNNKWGIKEMRLG